MSYGVALIRIVVGLSFAGHGAQKLFGSFGGGGPAGTAQMFRNLRFRAPLTMAVLAALAELGGLAFAAGFLTPLAALGICVVMLNAVATVHWPKGFWNTNGGFEFNLTLLAVAVGACMTGPGRFSLDRAIGWDDEISGLSWGVGVLTAAVLTSALALTLLRTGPEQTEEKQELRRAA